MKTAILGLGSNMGDRLAYLKNACTALENLPRTQIAVLSTIYETEPIGFLDQSDFLNMVIKIETEFSASALLGACLGIEAALGRRRSFKNAARVIDIDLLIYEGVSQNTPELILPHPRMHERAFVLEPLKDIYSDLNVFGHCFMNDYKHINKSGVRSLGYDALNLKDVTE